MGIFDSIGAAMSIMPSDYKEARRYYSDMLQAKIDDTWWMAPDNYEIQVENIRGSRVFSPVVCRINHAINPKTGLNLGDDFKELKFLDLEFPATMGYRFVFDDNWWIVTNTDNYNAVTKAVVVRRCNNVLKYIHNGQIVEEPCIVDYAEKYSNIYYNDVQDIPQGTIEVICQNNPNSRRIDYNDRFILGDYVYKVKVVRDYLREKTWVGNSNPLIQFSMYVDTKAPDDDFVHGIASASTYNYNENPSPIPDDSVQIVITPTVDYLLAGETIKYSLHLYKNGKEVPCIFTANASGVPDDYFNIETVNDNTFKITNIKPYYGGNLTVVFQAVNEPYHKTIFLSLKGLY